MGEVSYKLMQTIILRNLRSDLQAIVDKYNKISETLDRADPEYIQKALELSNQMFAEMNKIQVETLKKYEKELEGLNVS